MPRPYKEEDIRVCDTTKPTRATAALCQPSRRAVSQSTSRRSDASRSRSRSRSTSRSATRSPPPSSSSSSHSSSTRYQVNDKRKASTSRDSKRHSVGSGEQTATHNQLQRRIRLQSAHCFRSELCVYKVHHQFIPYGKEVQQKRMEVCYEAARDLYARPVSQLKNEKWQSCAWKYCNMARICEADWQMIYLGRETYPEQDIRGYIEWRFNLKEVGFKAKKLKVAALHTAFRNGEVKITAGPRTSSERFILTVSPRGSPLCIEEAVGWEDFLIRVELSGACVDGQVSQDSQLFPQFSPEVYGEQAESGLRIVVDMCSLF
ncbi:peptide-N(4)-(N-acetyl-beta-glucosaminyl)asparagine amidase-like isoform X3 [Paramacrobiotus metropolitanus]|uniref:peptide-N(4)-(N-acetyl-beta- glucosaminyl)asparagine amidase-like isoform X3 n=1 Tax=Paramacrobiotus metropolitanus TaxID=2943436 RepID=UPI0024457C97|nr:peptide-N(4)-(N-acetyl-beta-glucosaminyl)asparagine amidase-like isoform X3 [Paramacrobiotus metropolitanus]